MHIILYWHSLDNVCIGISVAIVSAGWWSGNIVSGEISPFLLSSPLGTSGTLFLHAGLCGLVFVYILFLIPETKVCVYACGSLISRPPSYIHLHSSIDY